MSPGARFPAAIPAIAVVAALGVAGCGGSSKPGYCSDRSDLEQSVKDLGKVDLKSGGVSALEAQLKKVKDDAAQLASSAKNDFAPQTAALQSSLASLGQSVKALPKSPSLDQLTPIAVEVKNVANAVTGFVDATKSKCD